MEDENDVEVDDEDSVEHRSSLQPRDTADPLLGRPLSEQEQKIVNHQSESLLENLDIKQRASNQSGPMKKRKKKKGLSFSVGSRRSNQSKNLQNLPANLSEFSWIENTPANRFLLEEERQKIVEQKRQKELERKIKL
jgi:hypothetical protein